MINRKPTNCGDETCPACVVAGDFIFLGHHAGGYDKNDIVYQMEICFNRLRSTLDSVEATLDDMVQINLYLKDINDFRKARDVFYNKISLKGFLQKQKTYPSVSSRQGIYVHRLSLKS